MTYLIVNGFEAVGTAFAVGAACGEGMLQTKQKNYIFSLLKKCT